MPAQRVDIAVWKEEDPRVRRGMVVRAVEESCRKSGLDRVTVEELDRIRSRMPTPKLFG